MKEKNWAYREEMTEQDWLEAAGHYHPYAMLRLVRERGIPRTREGRRKLRLLACSCCRLLGPLLGKPHLRVLETIEGVDCWGPEVLVHIRALKVSPREAAGWLPECAVRGAIEATRRTNAADAVHVVLTETFDALARRPDTPGAVIWERAVEVERAQGELFREIFGNPFRPVTPEKAWLTWDSGAVPRLARCLYEERRFEELPILADALQEAGCDNEDILAHCRRPDGHVRGCWVLDLLRERG